MFFTGSADHRQTAARLAAVERKLQAIMDHLGVVEAEPELSEVLTHLQVGNKIQAIKAYRDATGAGLREAKEAVERIAGQRGL